MGESFLVSRLSSMGDVVCTLPVACALKRNFPSSKITWVVDPRFADIVRRCKSVDEAVICKPGIRPNTWPTFNRSFDIAFDMQGLLKSAIPVWRARAKQKLGYHWQREGASFFSSRVVPDPTSHHIVDQYVDVARAAGCQVHEAEFGLEPFAEDLERIDGLLLKNGVDGRFVVINATAAWATKRWPLASFAKVARELYELGVAPVAIGTSSDRGTNDELANLAGVPVPNLAGQTGVADLIALISRSCAHLGGDTGSTHIAAALGVPAIGLYSITNPVRSCPYGQYHRCHYSSESLASIKPDAVLESVREVLQ